MKKALIVTRVSGFVPQFEMNNVKLLQQMGYEVHYAANYDTVVYGKDNRRLDGTGIIQHHIPFCRSPFSREVRSSYDSLLQLMQKENFDLIHCHMPMTGVVTRLAARSMQKKTKKCVPVLYTAHGFHFCKGAPLQNWIYYIPERFLARYTDVLITMNEEDYTRACHFPLRGEAKKISGVGISLENRPIKKISSGSEAASNKMFHLISVGELNANKNHIAVLREITKLPDDHLKHFHYTIYGEGSMRKQLEQYILTHGLSKTVTLGGYCDNIPHLLTTADAFLLPSKREGLPVALMEAMAAGLPVIAQPIRGCRDLITDGKGGFLSTEDHFAEAILSLMDDNSCCQQMGQYNRKKIQQFSTAKVEAQMSEIYASVCGMGN